MKQHIKGFLVLAGLFLLFVGNSAQAQTLYRFEIKLFDNTVKTLTVDKGVVTAQTLEGGESEATTVKERFILKQSNGYCYIASATDQRLFLKRDGNNVVLAELNNTSTPSSDYQWKIIYAGNMKGCLVSNDLGKLLKVNTNGSLQMINYASGSGGNIKFTITKVTNSL